MSRHELSITTNILDSVGDDCYRFFLSIFTIPLVRVEKLEDFGRNRLDKIWWKRVKFLVNFSLFFFFSRSEGEKIIYRGLFSLTRFLLSEEEKFKISLRISFLAF